MNQQHQISVAKAVARLFAAYPYLRPEQVREGAAAYADSLVDLPADLVAEAIRDLCQRSDRLPAIREIRELANQSRPQSQPLLSGPSRDAHRRAKAIYAERLASLHSATESMRVSLVAANRISDAEARDRLEQEIRCRLWDAAQREAFGQARVGMVITDVEKTGWRERCETWGRMKPNDALVWKLPDDMDEKEAA